MKKFLNLLTDELIRARSFYLSLLSALFILEFLLVLRSFINAASDLDLNPEPFSKISLVSIFLNSAGFSMILGGAILAMLIYCLYSWMREWVFQDKFIYRLLLLPGSRVTIAYAKLASVFLMIAGLILSQIIIFILTNLIGNLMPDLYNIHPWYLTVAQSINSLYIMMPFNPTSTLIVYGLGLVFLLVFFNICIIFFSYRSHGFMKTIVFSSLLTIGHIIAYTLILMMLLQYLTLTSSELIGIFIVLNLLVMFLDFWLMHYLMNRYISV